LNHQIVPLQPGLYLVATPIGTARDITLRALDVLASAQILVAEDTRSLKKLLAIHGVPLGDRPVWAYHDHSDPGARASIAAEVRAGRSVAYASEAGTPMVSDPGFALARTVVAAGGAVTTAPGPSAVIAALTLAGLPTDRFVFLGFAPARAAARRTLIDGFADTPATLVFYESPRRVHALLADLVACLGPDREAALCRELTKRFEEVQRAPLADLVVALAGRTLKGECVVLVGPPTAKEVSAESVSDALDTALEAHSVKDAAALVAQRFGVPRKQVYQMALERGRGGAKGDD
jgi:16S rRNA (cytidine1402-2'-O)-methyltransferase